MTKCILFSRVSTEHQSLESQTQVLWDEAIRLGYDRNDLILIEQKESAIKLDEEERIGLNMLKDKIYSDDTIDCVICYEVSRISRHPKILYSIRDFLLDRHIQLIIIKPYLKVMDEDGKLSESASLMFSIYASFSEIEMSTKKTRMMRGRKYKMQNGKYGGGWIAFGYMKDDNDNILIDEKEAKIVHKIYDMYEQGWSARSIAKELIALGEIPQVTQDAGQQFITKTIQREQYVGSGKGTNYVYPQIITQEQYDRCKAIRANKAKPRTGTSVQYYGHGLVYNEMGRLLTPSKANNVYTSYHIDAKHTASINLNMIDSIIWHITKEHISHNTIPNIAEQRQQVAEKLEIARKKIKAIDKQIEEQNKKISRAEKMILDGIVSMSRGSNHIMNARRTIDELQLKKDDLKYKENIVMNEYIYVNSFVYEIEGPNINLDNITEDSERIKLIKQTIKRIDAVKDDSHMMGRYWLTFSFTDDKIERYKIRTTGHRKDLYDKDGNQIIFEMLKRV